jgi:hypothetical protein
MKILFAGPTIRGLAIPRHTSLEVRPPARQGDIFLAVERQANVIGLIDGVYEQVPAIWHKEILYALSKGVQVFGAASMGALRAAECAAFGMVGIGEIFEAYADGRLEDDADVAQLHGPLDVDYVPLSEPMVNLIATFDRLSVAAAITPAEHAALLESASAIFFKERTMKALVERAGLSARSSEILSLLRSAYVNQKRMDAELLMGIMEALPDHRISPPADWTFRETGFWADLFGNSRG